MTQQEVEKILKKYPKGLTSKEIAKILGNDPSAVSTNLSKLIKYKEAVRVRIKYINKKYSYLYFINHEKRIW